MEFVQELHKQELFQEYAKQTHDYYHVLPFFKHFYLSRKGVISYVPVHLPWNRYLLVPLDPLADSENLKELICEFENSKEMQKVYAGVSLETAELLKEEGYRINDFGSNCHLEFSTFHLQGKEKEYLRRVNNYYKKGLRVVEVSDPSDIWNEVCDVSSSWQTEKAVKTKEVRLFTRPLCEKTKWKVRHFFCFNGDKLLGYVFFDPIFKNTKLVGYVTSVLRARSGVRPQGVLDYIILKAYEIFKTEIGPSGYLSLGFAPLAHIEKRPDDLPSLRYLMKFLFRYGTRLYNFQGLAHHKSLYRPTYEKLYICTKNISAISAALGITKARAINVSDYLS